MKHHPPIFKPRKRFGQHFLRDHYVIQQLVSVIAPSQQDHLVEIGPGLGALTQRIVPLVDKLDVIELDRDLIPWLLSLSRSMKNLTVHQADALTFDFQKLVDDHPLLRIVGNLPYNISTPLLFHLLQQVVVIKDMHFMLQKEVVERLAASVGTSAYGRLSIMVQYYCHVELLFYVPPSAFEPPPAVESAIVRLIPHTKLPFKAKDFSLFTQVVRQAFSHRRKTLRNCLKGLAAPEQLSDLGIDLKKRPEELSVSDYVRIANTLT